MFQTRVPWLAISVLLTELPRTDRQADVERGQRLIASNFARYSDPSKPVSNTPMWNLLVELREHMQDSPNQTPAAVEYSTIGTNRMPLTDDLMLDFGDQQALDAMIYNDQLILQDSQDLPWYASNLFPQDIIWDFCCAADNGTNRLSSQFSSTH